MEVKIKKIGYNVGTVGWLATGFSTGELIVRDIDGDSMRHKMTSKEALIFRDRMKNVAFTLGHACKGLGVSAINVAEAALALGEAISKLKKGGRRMKYKERQRGGVND